MARVTSKHARPAQALVTADDKSVEKETGWNALEELRVVALAAGCTKAQFEEAIESVGSDPFQVANYIQRYQFSQATSGKINGR